MPIKLRFKLTFYFIFQAMMIFSGVSYSDFKVKFRMLLIERWVMRMAWIDPAYF